MGGGVFRAGLGGRLHLHLAIDAHSQIDGADDAEGKDRRDQRKLDRRQTGSGIAAGSEQSAQVFPQSREGRRQGVVLFYSTRRANAEPIGRVPEPVQLTAKFEFPTNVMVLAISWRHPLVESAPPANVTA